MRTRLVAAFAVFLLVGGAQALRAEMEGQGPEFQVNTYTTGDQRQPAIAGDASGRFVVTWQSGSYYTSGQDGSRTGVFGRRFDPAGTPVGSDFQVNTYTTGPQFDSDVTMDAAGRFIVSWSSGYFDDNYPTQDGSASGAFVRRFDTSGAALGPEFQANTYTSGNQRQTSVAADASGNFVVVWTSGSYYGAHQDGSLSGVFAQRYDASGAPLGTEFQVNTYTPDFQSYAAVARESSGGFVVVWQSGGYYGSGPDGSNTAIAARRFSSTGTPLGAEFVVNSYTTGRQDYPTVAADPAGGFVVVWESGSYGPSQDGSGRGIFAQRYDATGAVVGPEFQVNSYTTGSQMYPTVAVDAAGRFVVVWRGAYDQDGSGTGIFGQAFTSAGTADGPEFQVNTYTRYYQDNPVVAAGSEGTFTVAWQGTYGQDGSGRGIFARQFRSAGPLRALPGSMLRLRDNPITASARRLLVRSVDAGITLGGGNGSVDDPTLTGGRLHVKSALFDDVYELPAANWKTIGGGANQGYIYRDRLLTAGPVSSVKVRASGLLRVSAKGAQLGHTLGGNPDPVTVTLQTGNLGHRYCMTFGGATKYAPGTLFRATVAPAVCAP
jgi:hypothetical protein